MDPNQQNQGIDDPQFVELMGRMYIAKKFSYVANNVHAGNDKIASTIQIDTDANFQLLFLIGSRTSALVTIEVFEGGAGGLAWQSDPVNIDNFLGTAQLPFPLVIPQLLPKNRVYKVQTVDTSGSANTVQVIFEGYKLYPAEQAAQVGAAPEN